MRASRVGRNVAVVGMALALGAVEARAQTVVQGCEQLSILGGAGAGGLTTKASFFAFAVAGGIGPGSSPTRLVLAASDEGFLCVPGVQEVAAGTSRADLHSGENVYIRGFGVFPHVAGAPSAGASARAPVVVLDFDENKKRISLRKRGPVVTREE